jgi:hypothetical protein
VIQEFVNTWNGKPCEVEDASNRDQCMDLAFAWLDRLGVPRHTIRNLYAYQAYTNFRGDAYFERIANTPDGVPLPGDLVVWDTSVGVAGHIAIFVSGNAHTFTSFDQNWPSGSKCHLQSHNYNGVIGWLRPRALHKREEEGMSLLPAGKVRELYVNYLGREPENEQVLQNRTELGFYRDALGEIKGLRESQAEQIRQLSARVGELDRALQSAVATVDKQQKALDEAGAGSAALTREVERLSRRVEQLQNAAPAVTFDQFSLAELLVAAFHKLAKIK